MDMIKHNPIPVALIGIGLGWMIFSGRSGGARQDHRGPDRHRHNGRGRSGRIEGAVDTAVDAASDLAARVGEQASAYTGKVTDKASAYYDQVADKAGSYYDNARSYAGSTYSRVEGTMQSNPLLVGGIGLAIGVAIGTVLPMTAQEQEYLGEARDHLLQQAEDLGHEAMARARETAEVAGRAAFQGAERHLSGEGQATQGGQANDAALPRSGKPAGAGGSKTNPTI